MIDDLNLSSIINNRVNDKVKLPKLDSEIGKSFVEQIEPLSTRLQKGQNNVDKVFYITVNGRSVEVSKQTFEAFKCIIQLQPMNTLERKAKALFIDKILKLITSRPLPIINLKTLPKEYKKIYTELEETLLDSKEYRRVIGSVVNGKP